MPPVINWQRILDTNNIEYTDRGANVKRGNLNIRCPFCGGADPSKHMGIALDTGYWACWRNSDHRGKSPVRLLVKLLRISYGKARELAGLDVDYVDPDGFSEVVERFTSRQSADQAVEKSLYVPDDFVELRPSGSTRRHWNYMVNVRGFDDTYLDKLCYDYYLMAAISGKFKDRVIFPYLVNDQLVSWSGRAIADASIRYRDCELDLCVIPPKETLYNHDAMLQGGTNLIVVEGPMDTLKLDFYGKEWGTRAVGISTNSMTDEQIYLLDEYSRNFDNTYFMMDNKSTLGIVDSMKLKQRLSQVHNPHIINVPFNKGDAGALTPDEVVIFCRRIS